MKKFVESNNASSEKYKRALNKIANEKICPFCLDFIELKEPKFHKKKIVRKNSSWVLTENMYPYEGTTKHLLIILLRHVRFISDITDIESADLINLINWSKKIYKLKAFSIFCRNGDTTRTGSSVEHLHLQLISGGRKNEKKPLRVKLAYKK